MRNAGFHSRMFDPDDDDSHEGCGRTTPTPPTASHPAVGATASPSWSCRILMLVAALAVGVWMYTQARVDTAGDVAFDQPLHIPPLLEPQTDSDGRAVFDLHTSKAP